MISERWFVWPGILFKVPRSASKKQKREERAASENVGEDDDDERDVGLYQREKGEKVGFIENTAMRHRWGG